MRFVHSERGFVFNLGNQRMLTLRVISRIGRLIRWIVGYLDESSDRCITTSSLPCAKNILKFLRVCSRAIRKGNAQVERHRNKFIPPTHQPSHKSLILYPRRFPASSCGEIGSLFLHVCLSSISNSMQRVTYVIRTKFESPKNSLSMVHLGHRDDRGWKVGFRSAKQSLRTFSIKVNDTMKMRS